MNFEADTLIKTLFESFPGSIFMAHTALTQLRSNEYLSPAGLLNTKTILFCHRHLNHLYQLIEYLASEPELPGTFKTSSFDSENLLTEITSEFTKTISGYSLATVSCCSKLKKPHPVQINKSKFETVILNLLYCCLKTTDLSDADKPKLNLSVGETAKNIVFHIRSNSLGDNSEFITRFLSEPDFCKTDIYSQDAVLAASLEIASRFVRESEGRLTYKVLKSGCRFDLTLPKFPRTPSKSLNDVRIFIPKTKIYEETFAELIFLKLANSEKTEVLLP